MIKSRRRTDGEENCTTCLRLTKTDKTGIMRCRIDGAYARDGDAIGEVVCDKYIPRREEKNNAKMQDMRQKNETQSGKQVRGED